jgi:hypothetical protein
MMSEDQHHFSLLTGLVQKIIMSMYEGNPFINKVIVYILPVVAKIKLILLI